MRISEEPTINKAAFAEDLTNAIINIGGSDRSPR